MPLKICVLTFVLMSMTLAASNGWSQSSTDEAASSGQQQPAASQPAKKPPHKSLFPEDLQGLQQMAIKSYEDGEYLRFLQATFKLREKRPYEQQYLVGLVVGASLVGRATLAYNYMHVMQQQGLSYDFNSTEDTESIRSTEVYTYLNDLLIKAGEPMGEGRVAFTLPESSVQPETIAWDDSRGKFLIGTIDSGSILAVTPSGEVEELLHATDENGLLAITGIAVDKTRNRLWVSTAGVPGFARVIPTDLGRGALVEFDLDSLKLLHRYDVPVDGLPHVPANMVLTPAGDVYLIDRAVQIVFRKPAGGKKLEFFLANKELAGLRDIALSDQGDKLYLADAALGIVVIDLEKKASTMLSGPETLNLGGISGLMYSEGSLLLLQNGITPQRLMRLKLDAGGQSVVETKPLAVALEYFHAPSFGTVHDEAVYYFASGNVPGARSDPAPVVVLKTPLELSEAIVPVEQRQFDADLLKKKSQGHADQSPDGGS